MELRLFEILHSAVILIIPPVDLAHDEQLKDEASNAAGVDAVEPDVDDRYCGKEKFPDTEAVLDDNWDCVVPYNLVGASNPSLLFFSGKNTRPGEPLSLSGVAPLCPRRQRLQL